MMADLAELADRKQQATSLIVEAAITSFLSADDSDQREAAMTRRLDRLTRQGERLERDLWIAAETLALFIRFWLATTPRLPQSAQAAAQPGAERRYVTQSRCAAEEGEGPGARIGEWLTSREQTPGPSRINSSASAPMRTRGGTNPRKSAPNAGANSLAFLHWRSTMKRKVTVRLSEQIIERLQAAAERQGASKAAIMEAVLDNFLSSDVEPSKSIKDAATLRRLNWMSHQLEQLERDLRIVNETVALHARYHLTVTPPLPSSQQPAACALGRERFEAFAAQVGRRVHLGAPLMRETMDRLSATSPALFARDIEEGAALGTPHRSACTCPKAEGAVDCWAGLIRFRA